MRIFKVDRTKVISKSTPTEVQKKREDTKREAKEKFAENLRNNPTESEALFCRLLDTLKISYQFQPVICGYIPDFLLADNKIIELDGKIHDNRKKYDRKRDDVLRKSGYRVMLVASNRLFWDTDRLTRQVKDFIAGRKITTNKKRRRRPTRTPGTDSLYMQFLQATEGL